MNKTAYVICWFGIVGGVPHFKGAGIYSEDAESITTDGNSFPMDACHADGNDYEDAIANVTSMCREYRRLRWLLPYIAPELV
jgi:hypothetical protein